LWHSFLNYYVSQGILEINSDDDSCIGFITVMQYYFLVIESYGNAEAKRIFEDGERKKLPKDLLKRAILILDIMNNVESLEDLKIKGFPSDLRLHKLKGEFQGRFAIDINKVKGWRFTFVFEDNVFKSEKVENYHRG
tara:strand:- start:12801 stop:13211 length:411 start_codon:yes stop_codon:yes gene_type:complete